MTVNIGVFSISNEKHKGSQEGRGLPEIPCYLSVTSCRQSCCLLQQCNTNTSNPKRSPFTYSWTYIVISDQQFNVLILSHKTAKKKSIN